jgi:hypothetical protein
LPLNGRYCSLNCKQGQAENDPNDRSCSSTDGTRWKLTEDAAIAGMKTGKWRFWTAGQRKSVWIVAAKSASGREYLKAEPDWVQPATLLALPECP